MHYPMSESLLSKTKRQENKQSWHVFFTELQELWKVERVPSGRCIAFHSWGKKVQVPRFTQLGKVVIAGTQRTSGYSPVLLFIREQFKKATLFWDFSFFKHKTQLWGSYPELLLQTAQGLGWNPTTWITKDPVVLLFGEPPVEWSLCSFLVLEFLMFELSYSIVKRWKATGFFFFFF